MLEQYQRERAANAEGSEEHSPALASPPAIIIVHPPAIRGSARRCLDTPGRHDQRVPGLAGDQHSAGQGAGGGRAGPARWDSTLGALRPDDGASNDGTTIPLHFTPSGVAFVADLHLNQERGKL